MTRATDFELVSAVAHELKTPLATVRNAAQALGNEAAGVETRERLVAAIVAAAEQLERLVDDLLTAGRLGARRLEIRAEHCDACALAAEAIGVAQLGADAPVEVELDAPAAAAVLADPGRLQQVLANLLDNAIIHGGGHVVVEVSSPRPDTVRITVTDDGPGIPAAEREHVFEPYHRLAGGSVRGTGLGLLLARELAEAMGGSLVAEDAPRGGAQLVLELPAA